MKNLLTLRLAAPFALLALASACNKQPETAAADNATDAAAKAPVELPPMVIASHTYRCADGSLVYVDFFNNNTAMYKTEKEAPTGTQLKSEGEGKPFTADGYSISGNGSDVKIAAPGKPSQSCKS